MSSHKHSVIVAHHLQRLLDDGDSVTVFDVDLFTKRWEMLLSQDEIAKVCSTL